MIKYFKDELPEIEKLYNPQLSPEFEDHGMTHILNVVSEAQYICKEIHLPYNNKIELACLLHDIGLIHGRKNHNINSMSMAREFINNHLDYIKADDKRDILRAILQHRVGYKPVDADEYFPIISQVVSAADKCIISKDNVTIYTEIVRRFTKYLYNVEKDNREEVYDGIYKYLNRVYGINGVLYNNPLIKKFKNDLPSFIDEKINKPSFKVNIDKYIAEIRRGVE